MRKRGRIVLLHFVGQMPLAGIAWQAVNHLANRAKASRNDNRPPAWLSLASTPANRNRDPRQGGGQFQTLQHMHDHLIAVTKST